MPKPEANHGDALYAALDALRHAVDVHAKALAPAWRTVMMFVHGIRPIDPDAQQETLLRIARNVSTFAGQSPGEAVRWVKTIHTRKNIDAVRKESRDLVAKNLDRTRGDEETPATVETLASPAPAPSARALAAFQERVIERVDAFLLHTVPNDSARRHLRRTWARAAYLRLVHEFDSDSIVRELGVPTSTSKDLISKWVERGRAVLVETLSDWDADDDDKLAAEALTELVQGRRSDAGKARIHRRKSSSSQPKEDR